MMAATVAGAHSYIYGQRDSEVVMHTDFFNALSLLFGHFALKNLQRYSRSSSTKMRHMVSWMAGALKIQKKLYFPRALP